MALSDNRLVVETLFDPESNRQHKIGQKYDGSDQRNETGGTQQVQSERFSWIITLAGQIIIYNYY